MNDLLEISEAVNRIRSECMITDLKDNDMVDAYNQGIDMMAQRVLVHLNNLALKKAFGIDMFGGDK